MAGQLCGHPSNHALSSASLLTGVQVPELELPYGTPVPEVTTPEPGVYHGICEYPVLGRCQVEEGPSEVGGSPGHSGQGPLGQLDRLSIVQRCWPRASGGRNQHTDKENLHSPCPRGAGARSSEKSEIWIFM